MTPTELPDVVVREALPDEWAVLADLYSDAAARGGPADATGHAHGRGAPRLLPPTRLRGRRAHGLGGGGRRRGARLRRLHPGVPGRHLHPGRPEGSGRRLAPPRRRRRDAPRRATSSGCSSQTSAPGGSTSAAGSWRSSAPTGPATRRRRRTSGWPGAPPRPPAEAGRARAARGVSRHSTQAKAFVTSAVTVFSSAVLRDVTAYSVGQMSPSSSAAWSLKPIVA